MFVMKLAGTEVVNGVTCEKWEYVTSYGDKSNRYTMWLQRQVFYFLKKFAYPATTNLNKIRRLPETIKQKFQYRSVMK